MGHIGGVKAILDGQPLAVPRPTLAAALQAAVDAARARGNVIVEVKLDGQRIGDDQLSSPADVPMGGQLTFVSANPGELVSSAMRDAGEALTAAREEQAQAAGEVQAGRPERAMGALHGCFATWQSVLEVATQGCAMRGVGLHQALTPELGSVADAISELHGHLRSLRDALAAEDWSAVSDILAYDLDAQVSRWLALLGHLARPAGAGAG